MFSGCPSINCRVSEYGILRVSIYQQPGVQELLLKHLACLSHILLLLSTGISVVHFSIRFINRVI